MTVPAATVEARGVSKAFAHGDNGTLRVLEDVSFTINRGEFVSIVGPSGCGKTTLLNITAGLTSPSAGTVVVSGTPVAGPGRDRAFVFQDPSLLPWRNVLGNVVFGVECQGVNPKSVQGRARELVDLVGLRGFEKHYPHQLSGGMRQRVNLARALLADPDVLLMDEPFAALDAQTRELMQVELLRVWQETGKTVLFITHQINEAVFLSDRVLVFGANPGRVLRDVSIDVARPRSATMMRDETLVSYERDIWELLQRSGAEPRV